MPLTNSGIRARYVAILFMVLLLMYWGKTLFIPMSYGLLIAIVMYPICAWLERHRFPRALAVTISLVIVILLFLLLIWLLILQIQVFEKDWPELKARIGPSFTELQNWIDKNIGFSLAEQQAWLARQKENAGNAGEFLPSFIRSLSTSLFILFITPVFAALFLYNRGRFVGFFRLLAGEKYQGQFDDILKQTVHTYFNYIKGMIAVYAIVGILNSIGLLAIGVRHALLFGFLTAIMTIIPYIGIVVSSLLPISISWIDTGSIWTPLGVIGVFVFVQYLEANIIFPKVVGTRLNVSTWAMLVFIIAGGIIWGVSGMILFIPFAAILKILSGKFEAGKPWNLLLSS